jgi:hypothetical protein
MVPATMSLPIINSIDSDRIDIQPWLLIRVESREGLEAALWSIDGIGNALAIFSTEEKAGDYCQIISRPSKEASVSPSLTSDMASDVVSQSQASRWRPIQPEQIVFGHTLIAHYRAGVRWLALDPSDREAKRLFALADVLRAMRDRLTAPT